MTEMILNSRSFGYIGNLVAFMLRQKREREK